jgi:hypothetical protein
MPRSKGPAQPRAPSQEQLKELKKLGNNTITLYKLLEQDRKKLYQYHHKNKDGKILKTFECRKCKENSPTYKKAHALYCPINVLFGMTYDEVMEEQRQAQNRWPVKDGPVASYGIKQALAKQQGPAAAMKQSTATASSATKMQAQQAPAKQKYYNPYAKKNVKPSAKNQLKHPPPAAAAIAATAFPAIASPEAASISTIAPVPVTADRGTVPPSAPTANATPGLAMVVATPVPAAADATKAPPTGAPVPLSVDSLKTAPSATANARPEDDLNVAAVAPGRAPAPKNPPTVATPLVGVASSTKSSTDESLIETAESLQLAVAQFMAEQSTSSSLDHIQHIPAPILGVFRYMHLKCPVLSKETGKALQGSKAFVNLKKIEWWYANFPEGTISLKIPNACRTDMQLPDPNYHSVEGAELFFARWEFAAPKLKIPCPKHDCVGSELVAGRIDLSKASAYTRIVEPNNMHRYSIASYYTCNTCGESYHGNDGRVLAALPAYLQRAYPVDPRYACSHRSTKCQFHINATRQFEFLSVPHVPSTAYIRSIYVSYGQQYEDYQRAYWSHVLQCRLAGCLTTEQPHPYPSFLEFCGGKLALPGPDRLLEEMEAAFRSTLVPYGISDYDRCNREIQSVECHVALTTDHHFAAMANYNKRTLQAGPNGCFWTTMTETGEVPCIAMVPSTATSDIAHAAQQLSQRRNFQPLGLWQDTYPNKFGFWKLLWPGILGHLGLYHWLQRLSKTLRQRHPDYHKALRALSDCAYYFHPDDENSVVEALCSGTMNQGGPMSDAAIVSLKRDGTFRKRYAQFMRKIFYKASRIKLNLTEWYANFKAKASKDSILPAGGVRSEIDGTSLFTPETMTAYQAALVSCDDLPDKIPFDKVYHSQNAPAGAKHGLPIFRAQRGESNLESMHSLFPHFANSGMKPSVADMLSSLGTTRFNSQAREKMRVGSMTAAEMQEMPAHQRGIPLHYNHSSLHHINDLAAEAGSPSPPFADVRSLPRDNGERFFSEYLTQQLERNEKYEAHPVNDLCQCPHCLTARPAAMVAQIPPMETLEPSTCEQANVDSPAEEEALATCGDEGEYSLNWEDNAEETATPGSSNKRNFDKVEFCDLAPRPTPPYLPNPYPQPGLSTLQPPSLNCPPLSAYPTSFGYPHPAALSYPHFPAAAGAMTPLTYHHWRAPHAPPLAKRPKPQVEYCCQSFMNYVMVTRAKGRKAGRPPHDSDCKRARQQDSHT